MRPTNRSNATAQRITALAAWVPFLFLSIGVVSCQQPQTAPPAATTGDAPSLEEARAMLEKATLALSRVSATEPKEAIDAGKDALVRFMEAFNSRDINAWRATLHYPHVRLASGDVVLNETAAQYASEDFFATFAERFSWHHSEWDFMVPIQADATKVHFATRFTRYREDGSALASFESL